MLLVLLVLVLLVLVLLVLVLVVLVLLVVPVPPPLAALASSWPLVATLGGRPHSIQRGSSTKLAPFLSLSLYVVQSNARR